MRSIRTLFIAPDSNVWLANTRRPHILHVFDRACNLINEEREVLSIVTSKIGKGPFNLVVEDWVLFSENLQIEAPVSILDDQLVVGDLLFRTGDAEYWSPFPDWKRLYDDRGKIASRLAALPILASQSPAPFTSNLSTALARGDGSASKLSASRLAGLGIGLTPAGDDFILGALYATWIIHPAVEAEFLAGEIANAAAPLTTSLSAAWLRSAGKGEAAAFWHEFFDALICSDPVQVRSAIENIMSMGATSGAEALAGFMATFDSYAEIKDKHVLPRSIYS